VLDFGGYASNRFSASTALSSAGLRSDVFGTDGSSLAFTNNGTSFSFDSSSTMTQIMKAVNSSSAGVKMTYSSLTDTFSLASSETGAASSVSFEDTDGSLMSTLFSGATTTAGTDTVVKLSTNGSTDESDMITLTRSSNTLTVDGTTITLNGKAADDAEEGINISLGYDTDAIATKIETFLTDYNELLASLTDALSEEKYSDYEPLTDDERDKLTDTEAEQWMAKAKSGLLNSDSYLISIVADLRSGMSTLVGGLDGNSDAGILADLGITTGAYSEKGQLHLDTTKLREALEADPEKVLDVFAQKSDVSYSAYATTEQKTQRFKESGVLWRLSDVFTKNLSTVGKKGSLIMLVGSPSSSYNTNTEYAKKITALESKISDMEDSMDDEEDRYWTRFTAMETALQSMQSQSSWISSMLGSSN
jgi:flagellar hook-associated protein 2